MVIGEREGKVDNKTRIELIKEEVEKIKEEKKEEEEATAVLEDTAVSSALLYLHVVCYMEVNARERELFYYEHLIILIYCIDKP